MKNTHNGPNSRRKTPYYELMKGSKRSGPEHAERVSNADSRKPYSDRAVCGRRGTSKTPSAEHEFLSMHKSISRGTSRTLDILYEDEYITIVHKPAGMMSVPYPGFSGKTAIDVLEQIRRKRGLVSANSKPFAVHRLDRETSGVMMFALSAKVRDAVMDTWQTMVTSRTYRALAVKTRKDDIPLEGTINEPLTENAYHNMFVPDKKAGVKLISAVTHYSIIKSSPALTLFELNLETGRKNQIRAHLAYAGYPIAGDSTYRSPQDPFGRLCLHARTLAFTHPYTGEHLSFEVPEPEEWLKAAAQKTKNRNEH